MGWHARRNLYESIAASGITSETYWVGDAGSISLQLIGSPSTTTVRGSNADGRSAAIGATEWSTITTVAAGMYSIEPGFRWLQLQRSETTSAWLSVQQPW